MGKEREKRDIKYAERLTLAIQELHKQLELAFKNRDWGKFRQIQDELIDKTKKLLAFEWDLESQIKAGLSDEQMDLLLTAAFGKTKEEILKALKEREK